MTVKLESKVCPCCKEEKELWNFNENKFHFSTHKKSFRKKETEGFCTSCVSKYRAPKYNPKRDRVIYG